MVEPAKFELTLYRTAPPEVCATAVKSPRFLPSIRMLRTPAFPSSAVRIRSRPPFTVAVASALIDAVPASPGRCFTSAWNRASATWLLVTWA